ncbi:SDR family NAD(P)-dependent oxidoreductase [Actinomadura sp. 1N219]|uniref:SDR family NAD(P)-dependent oxidoreductase n=1 Tax=Actinomadura sp. 1N219 TaxID=3375152 RepID=UPI00378A476C
MNETISLVTGATSGIGKEIARALARRGHRVAIICRDPGKTRVTLAELRASAPGAVIEPFLADLSVMSDVRRVAGELRDRYAAVDVLVNNAGTHDLRPRTTCDGFDRMVATNHLGPFLLTNLLLEPLQAACGRVVMVASEMYRIAYRVDVEHLADPVDYPWYESIRAYGRTKLYNILFAQELAARQREVTVNAMCPGPVASNIVRDVPLMDRAARIVGRTPLVRTPLLSTPAQGAESAVRLAADPEFDGRGGRFHSSIPGLHLLPATRTRRDQMLQRRVWNRSAELVGCDPAGP